MTIRLIALDIDGTLLPPRAPVAALPDEGLRDTISRLRTAGVAVVLASGRMYPGTVRVARHLELDRPVICQQGASVHTLDGVVLHRFEIDPAVALELVDYAGRHGWDYAWYDPVRYLASARNDACAQYALASHVEPEYHDAPHEVGLPATGIDIISTPDHARTVHRELSGRFGDRAHFLDFPSVTAAHAPAAGKGNALALLAADLGIHARDVLAIGDSVNDVSMLRWAGYGAAPAHCDPHARAAADEILSGEGTAGVEAVLREVLRGLGD